MLGQCVLERGKDLSNRHAAMTHCVLLLIEKFGNCSTVWEQEDRVVTEAPGSSLVVKDRPVQDSFAGSNDPFRSGDGDGAHKTRASSPLRDVC